MRFKEIIGTIGKDKIFRLSILKIRIIGFVLLIAIIIIGILSVGDKLYKYIGLQPAPLSFLDRKDMTININADKETAILLKNDKILSTNELINKDKIDIMLDTRIPTCEKSNLIDNISYVFIDCISFFKNLIFNPFLSMDVYNENKHIKYLFYTYNDKYLLKISEIFIESNGIEKEDVFSCQIEKNDIFVKSIVNVITTK